MIVSINITRRFCVPDNSSIQLNHRLSLIWTFLSDSQKLFRALRFNKCWLFTLTIINDSTAISNTSAFYSRITLVLNLQRIRSHITLNSFVNLVQSFSYCRTRNGTMAFTCVYCACVSFWFSWIFFWYTYVFVGCFCVWIFNDILFFSDQCLICIFRYKIQSKNLL